MKKNFCMQNNQTFCSIVPVNYLRKISAAVATFSKIYSQKSTLQPVASYIQHPNMNQIETN
jgi:hypothetical protein